MSDPTLPTPEVSPAWYRDKLTAAGWRRCPDDEVCGTCGTLAAPQMSRCCTGHNHDRKLLPVDDDGRIDWPLPGRADLLERIAELDADHAYNLKRWDEADQTIVRLGDLAEKQERRIVQLEADLSPVAVAYGAPPVDPRQDERFRIVDWLRQLDAVSLLGLRTVSVITVAEAVAALADAIRRGEHENNEQPPRRDCASLTHQGNFNV